MLHLINCKCPEITEIMLIVCEHGQCACFSYFENKISLKPMIGCVCWGWGGGGGRRERWLRIQPRKLIYIAIYEEAQ